MADDKKVEVVTMNKDYHDMLLAQAKQSGELLKRLEKLESAPKGGPGMETTAMRYSNIYKAGLLAETPEAKKREAESIQVVDERATIDGDYVKDKCPWCIKFHAGKPTILDVTLGGKYSCRRCGKHWAPWAIVPEDGSDGPLKYNILLERNGGEKEPYFEWVRNEELKRLQTK